MDPDGERWIGGWVALEMILRLLDGRRTIDLVLGGG
jgi:hypothetical protein